MWDSLISNSGNSTALEILPSGLLWRLDEMNFNGVDMKLVFIASKEKKKMKVSFQPDYLSISDGWVEDHGGMNGKGANEWKKSAPVLSEVKLRISDAFPDQSDDYNKLETYVLSAMNWQIRFAGTDNPAVASAAYDD